MGLRVHLLDGTYELFRYHFALPSHVNDRGEEVSATRGVVGTVLQLLEGGATHLGVATDHVVESFRNDLYVGYKTGEGIEPDLLSQFPLIEEALVALGVVVWPMVEHEADDALAAAARAAAADDRVEQVIICTPDKDLGQCVGGKIVQLDRRADKISGVDEVIAKFGVPPASIPDYLALVGDTADGFPGLPGWGAKSAATVLARYSHLEAIPDDAADWDITVRSAAKLAATLAAQRDEALLFRLIATVVDDLPLFEDVATLRWTGPTNDFPAVCDRLDAPALVDRAARARNRLKPD